jgi:hypothetical protein
MGCRHRAEKQRQKKLQQDFCCRHFREAVDFHIGSERCFNTENMTVKGLSLIAQVGNGVIQTEAFKTQADPEIYLIGPV